MTASIRDDWAGLQKNRQTARHKLTNVSPIIAGFNQEYGK